MAWELIAVTAALITSKSRPGNRPSSNTSSWRGKPNAGSGSPSAADSPSTKTRVVPVGFSRRNNVGCDARASVGGRKRHANFVFSISAPFSWCGDATKNEVGCP
jgi:hypothetical protein